MRPTPALVRQNTARVTTVSSAPVRTEKRSELESLTDKRTHPFTRNDFLALLSFIQPERFFAEQRCALQQRGEYRLLVAVLQDALECWFRYRNAQRTRGQRLFREVEEWFSSHNQDRLFAFECICDYLALDPNYIRRGLTQWQSSQLERSVPRFYLTPVINSRTRMEYNESRKKQTRNRMWEE